MQHCYTLREKKTIKNCRGDTTRTCDHLVPNQVHYQLCYTPILRVQNYNYFLEYANRSLFFFCSLQKNWSFESYFVLLHTFFLEQTRTIMILPMYLYGQPVLRKTATPISNDYPDLQTLISDMFETMYKSDGIGLAAPQIGLSIRVIVIDASPLADDFPELADSKLTLINPQILAADGDDVTAEEGCLSLPGVHENVTRKNRIHITYFDEQWQAHDELVEGYLARVMQHEYDHLEGHVFTDRISPIRRQLIKGKLTNIAKGKARCSYKTKR